MKAVLWESLERRRRSATTCPSRRRGREVLVRVQASSANPVDNAIAAGMLRDMVPHEFPVTLGRDFAGVVEERRRRGRAPSRRATRSSGWSAAMGPAVHDGAWAERIVVPESSLARTPEGVDVATVGAAPLAAITAMLAVDALDLLPGDTVLIAGATGGVGSIASQLAAPPVRRCWRRPGPTTRTTCAGSASPTCPRDGDVVAAVRERHPDGVDAIVDLVNYAPGTYDARAQGRGPHRLADQRRRRRPRCARTSWRRPTPEILERIAGGSPTGRSRRADPADVRPGPGARGAPALASTHTQGKLALRMA